MFNVNGARREFPNWNTRAKIRKVDPEGNIVPNEYAFGGEIIRVSPRFQKNGTNYRVRPERPAYFFMFFCLENKLLPTALTIEECESEAGLEILQPLWDAYKGSFAKLESPYAACDRSTEPSLKVGFSFNIFQAVVESIGTVRSNNTKPTLHPAVNGSAPNSSTSESIFKRIQEMRARAAANKQEPTTPPRQDQVVHGKKKA
jgi:hypothetical protein